MSRVKSRAWFGAAASVGYGNSFHRKGASFNSAIANAEARFFLPHAARLVLGYDRDFFESIFANFYADDRIFLTFDLPLVYRLTAHAGGGVRFRNYDGLVPPTLVGYTGYAPSTTERSDLLYDAQRRAQRPRHQLAGLQRQLQPDRR